MKTVFPAVSASKLSWVSSMALAPEAAAARPTNRAVNFMVVVIAVVFLCESQRKRAACPRSKRQKIILWPDWTD